MLKNVFIFSIVLALTVSLVDSAEAAKSPFKNIDRIADSLNLATYAQSQSVKTVKIAILDNGFKGYKAQVGKTLPKSTVYHAGPVAVDAKSEEVHGLFMAQIVTGLLAKTPGIKYELHLFSAFGYSNLDKAVDTLVREKFDLALYAQVWEYGGNGDGKGFINAVVNKATSAGVTWINAAGNFGDNTYRAPV
ncbi:MAG: protease, partial [Proteobacteria bacterium]